MKSGTNDGSWKYNSILSPKDSRAVAENRYGPSILFITLKGVIIVYFSFAFDLSEMLSSSCTTPDPNSYGLQLLSLIKVHGAVGKFPRRQHVQYLANIRLCTKNKLVNNVCRYFHLFSRTKNRLFCASSRRKGTHLNAIVNIRERIAAASGLIQKDINLPEIKGNT